ncbi:hypothetical protein EJ08DRAFT_653993 [Tothia fuscella]|uniref:Uncharacterized protein n=1 Tax=Tothia fuscella TaxID=1048955 RepID=A0A9P4NFV6_9PEZI|nr:hypothetical protein EJ08DRAFT_653993 [Tothia fuscella]
MTRSRPVKHLDKLFLIARSGDVAVYPGAGSAEVGGKFFTTSYSGTLSIHPGDDTHQLGLSGPRGLLFLVDLERPSASSIPKDKPTEWSVFQIGPDGGLTVNDNQNIPTRKFVTFLDTDGTYYVGICAAGVTPQRRTLSNITLIATKSSPPTGRT